MSTRPSRSLGVILTLNIALVLCVSTAFAAGTAERAAEKPTLIWLTSVQGGREPEENTLFEKRINCPRRSDDVRGSRKLARAAQKGYLG